MLEDRLEGLKWKDIIRKNDGLAVSIDVKFWRNSGEILEEWLVVVYSRW